MATKKSDRKRLFLIDGFATLYRSHFALIRNPLITSSGLHTSALFGFVNQVFKLLRDEKPDYIAAIFDTDRKTFRHKMYPEYKATREKMPDELRQQIPHLWDLLKAMNMPTLSLQGYEADDIIGTLAKKGEEENIDVYIVSGDKDFMQLISEHVYLYAPGGRFAGTKIYDREAVIEKWGVPPEKIIDLLGLMGDSSDNIPGVKGVGEKSAVKLIKEYGSLEEALNNAERVGNKRVQNGLLSCKEKALLSKELVTIDTSVPIDTNIENFVRNGFNIEVLTTQFNDFEFYALAKQLNSFKDSQPVVEVDKSDKDYQTLLTSEAVNTFISNISSESILSFDLETTSIDPMQAEIVGISLSIKNDSGVYIPVIHKDKNEIYFGENELACLIPLIKPVLENPTILKSGQNIKYDALILKRFGIEVKGIQFDTMIAAHLLNPAARSIKLDSLALEYLNYQMVPIEDLIGRGRNQISMAEVELDNASFYAAEDAEIAYQLTQLLKEKLVEADLLNFFESIELPLIPVLLQMEFNGAYVDLDILQSMSTELGKKLDDLSASILKEAGTDFNINSTQQLAHILFDLLELPQIRKRSTAEEVLQVLKEQHPLPGYLLEYRKLNKLKNTYLDAFPDYVHPQTGRIHSNFNQTVAATGRLSSSNPNFQNIPIRTEIGREIRKAFRAQKTGWKIFSADYSQIELRIMAHLSQDPGLLEAFKDNVDVHSKTASQIFNVPLESVIPEMRRTAKIVNFGIMYGAGPFRMSQELGIPRREAQAIIDSYFEQYAGIRNYIDSTMEHAREKKFVKTMLGRKRPVWDADSDNRLRRDAAERMAINMPIQGTAAELIKLAMINIHNELKERQLQSKMILQIHDELLFEVPENEIEELKELVIEKMEYAMQLSVPLIVDWGVGDSWFEAH